MGKSKEKKKKQSSLGLEGDMDSADAKMGKQLETLDMKITAISDNPNRISPIVGYFPSGFDPLKISSEEPDSNSAAISRVNIYKYRKSPNPNKPRMKVVVGVDGSAVNFVGTNYSGEATTPQLCDYALGVLDKNTGVMKMVRIASNKIFRLEPKVFGMEQPEETPDEDTEIDTYEERAVKLKRVTGLYSTIKNKRRDEKREILRMTGDSAATEDMDRKLNDITVNYKALEESELIANERNVPPYNMEASEAEMAYPLDKIILKGDWDYLQDIFNIVDCGSELSPDVYPCFVCNRVQKLQNAKDELRRRRLGGILTYITHLIRFKDRYSVDGVVSSAKNHKLPGILFQRFSTMFGSSKDKRLPHEKLSLLVSYILVLSLFADDFHSDPSDIAKDLRMSPIDLRFNYEYLGCKFVRENQVLFATLPVPLEFHTQKNKRKKKRT